MRMMSTLKESVTNLVASEKLNWEDVLPRVAFECQKQKWTRQSLAFCPHTWTVASNFIRWLTITGSRRERIFERSRISSFLNLYSFKSPDTTSPLKIQR